MRLEELLQIDAEAFPRAEIPELLGIIASLDARLRLRLLTPPEPPKPKKNGRLLTPNEAASIAKVEVKWLKRATRGLPFRHQPTTKIIRYEETGFRDWLEGRRR